MGNPATEQNTPPQANTWRAFVRTTVLSLPVLSAFFGRRLSGSIGLVFDALSEGGNQSFYARLPGHPQQALDSLRQVGIDRDLFRFRGETDANFTTRVKNAWNDYAQAGTAIQMLRVIDQWGTAGWPATWVNHTVTLTESGSPTSFTFTINIPIGLINPPWTASLYGGTDIYGEPNFFYGLNQNNDLPVLLYLIAKWKPSRSKATLIVNIAGGSVSFFV